MSLDSQLLSKFLDQLTKMIRSRKEMISWVEEFIDDIQKQEIAINSTKTGAAALGVVSAIGLFTPFAPLALAGLVASGGAGLATSIGDFIANKVKGGNLKEKVDNMKNEDDDLQKLQTKLDEEAVLLAKELKVPKQDAYLFALVGGKIAAELGCQAVNGTIQLARALPHLKAIKDAMSLGATFSQAARLGGTVFQGARVSVAGIEGAAVAGTTFAVTAASKALGGLGAVIGIADVIISWSTKNPNRESAETLLPQLEENVKALKDMEKQFKQLQEL